MRFASDNSSAVPQAVLDALAKANEGYAMPYGADELTAGVEARIREVFDAPEAAVYLVATGTAANALALACLCPPWATVFCHRESHIEEDECAAPEFYTAGAKLTLIDGPDARIEPEALTATIAWTGALGVHNVQKGPLSITNPTERGAVYSPDEVAALAHVAKGHGLPVHMDGARFANALVATGASPAEMTWKAGVDVLSFGATKNGLMGAEAVVIFDPARAGEFGFRRKRGGHLFSKTRYLAAQLQAYLDDGLWLDLARRANAAATRLADGMRTVEGGALLHPVQANLAFASWPRAGHRRAGKAGATYYLAPATQSLEGPDDEALGARLVCSWSTESHDVDRFIATIRG